MSLKERQKAIRDIISKYEVEGQAELIELLLAKYNLETNQAAISRDLRSMGINKRKVNGRLIYDLDEGNISKKILQLAIVDVVHNEATIVVRTVPGLASFVGDFLDINEERVDILGTVSGENTLFVSPYSIKKIKESYEKVCKILHYKL